MSTIKIRMFTALAISVACVAIIYPRFIHPILIKIIGFSDRLDYQNLANLAGNLETPHLNSDRPDLQSAAGIAGSKPMARPEQREAGEVHKHQTEPGASRGMMGVVLPMYVVGTFAYLIYTFYKVFRRSRTHPHGNTQHGPQYGSKSVALWDGSSRSGLRKSPDNQSEQEHLLQADHKNVSMNEMRLLQKRLEDTEVQMSRILKAMNAVQANVDRMSSLEDHLQVKEDDLSDLYQDLANQKLLGKGSNNRGEIVNSRQHRDNPARRESGVECLLDPTDVKSLRGRVAEVDFDDIDRDSDDDDESPPTPARQSLTDFGSQDTSDYTNLRQRRVT